MANRKQVKKREPQEADQRPAEFHRSSAARLQGCPGHQPGPRTAEGATAEANGGVRRDECRGRRQKDENSKKEEVTDERYCQFV